MHQFKTVAWRDSQGANARTVQVRGITSLRKERAAQQAVPEAGIGSKVKHSGDVGIARVSNPKVRYALAFDSGFVLEICRSMLPVEQRADAISLMCNRGEQVTPLLRQHNPALLITDTNVFLLGGFEALPEWAAVSPRTRYLVTTGWSKDYHLVYKAFQDVSASVLLLPVPFSREQFIAALEEAESGPAQR